MLVGEGDGVIVGDGEGDGVTVGDGDGLGVDVGDGLAVADGDGLVVGDGMGVGVEPLLVIVKPSEKVPPEVPTNCILIWDAETVNCETPQVALLLAASQVRK